MSTLGYTGPTGATGPPFRPVYTATIHYDDGTTDTVSNVHEDAFESLYEDLDDKYDSKSFYLTRTDGATAMKKTGIKRIDILREWPTS